MSEKQCESHFGEHECMLGERHTTEHECKCGRKWQDTAARQSARDAVVEAAKVLHPQIDQVRTGDPKRVGDYICRSDLLDLRDALAALAKVEEGT